MQYSVVNYKTVRENSDFRIDAEYFHPSKLNSLRILKNNPIIFLGDYVLSIKRNETPKDSNIEIYDTGAASSHILTKNLAQTEERTSLKRRAKGGDIIISRLRPYLKQVAYIPTFIDKAYLTTEFFVLRSKDKENISFLTPFLLTEFVQEILFWGQGGTQHPRFQEYDLLNLPLTKNIFGLKEILNKIVSKCCKLVLESDHLYSQAEQFLLSELGLLDWKPKHTLAFVKNYSDTQKAERIDAEYFQPKYEEIIEAVKKYKGGFDELGNLVKINDKNFTPKDNEQYKYIELANISSNGEINGYTENFGNELPSRARRKVQKGDLVISTIEGSLESIALITEDWKNALCSTGFFVVNSNKLNPETLLVLLKTKVGQMQLKKGCKGTILTAIDKNELSKIVLPKIDSKTQEEIKAKITEMYEAKKLSKSLLEIAKRGVEIAIEKDEQEAEEWIESEIEKLGVKIQ
jgi:type I restriction enzyme S subunit